MWDEREVVAGVRQVCRTGAASSRSRRHSVGCYSEQRKLCHPRVKIEDIPVFHAGETEDRASRRPLVKWRTVAQAERVPDAGEVRRREKQAAASRVASCWTSVRSSRGVRSPGPVPAIQAYVAKATTQSIAEVMSQGRERMSSE